MSGPPRVMPAYGLSLMRRRWAGWTPWLVVAAVGAPVDWEPLRGDAGVARIGFGPRFAWERADVRCVFGLDVLVSFFGLAGLDEQGRAARDQRALEVLWGDGQAATVWELSVGEARERVPLVDADGVTFMPRDAWVRLGDLQNEVARAREIALAGRRGVFARPEFEAPRRALMDRMLASLQPRAAAPGVAGRP